VDVKHNIVALLQPLAPAGTNFTFDKKPEFEEENNFSNILEEATTKVKKAEEKAKSRSDGENKSSQTEEKNQDSKTSEDTKSSGENKSSQTEEKNQDSKTSEDTKSSNEEKVNSEESQAVNSTREFSDSAKDSIATEQTTPTNSTEVNLNTENPQDTIVQQLQTLGLEPEQIQTFLNLFDVNEITEVSNDFLEALDTQLNLFQKTPDGESFPAAPVETPNLSSLKAREKLAADFLRSVGIENNEASDLARKMIQVKTGESVSSDNMAIAMDASSSDNSLEALLGFLKEPIQKEIANKEQIVKLEKASTTQQVKKSENLTAAIKEAGTQATENAEIAVPRIKTQDPVAKIFEQVKFQTAPTEEGGLKPIKVGFQNPADNGSFMDLTNAKTSSEFMIQNAAKVNENFSSTLNEAKATANSKGLPNGVTEKSVVEQVVQKFAIKGTDNQNEIKIKLDPPALGTIRMNINTSGDSVKTTIIAENQAVKQAIEANLNQLKDSFTNQGMKIESFEVMVGGEPGFKENRQQQSQGGNFGNSNKTGFDQEAAETNLVGAYPSRYDFSPGGLSVIV
jgi:flagellar hook-length control protein FliK